MNKFFQLILFLLFAIPSPRLSRLEASMLDLAFEAHLNGELSKAEVYYHKAIEEGNNKSIIYYNLGNLYYSQKRLADAVLNYRQAIETAPSFKEAYLNLGRIYYLYERYERALEVFLAYQKQNSNDYENSLLLADTYKKLRMYPEALSSYRQAVHFNPYNEEGYIALADFFFNFDDLEAARQEAVAGYDNVGFSKSLVIYEADILREDQRYDEAVTVYRSLLHSEQVTNFSQKEHYDIELKIVDSLLSASNVNYAIYELEKMVENYPDKNIGINYLESIYLVYGKTDRGFIFFKRIYHKNPKLFYDVIKNFLAEAYNRDYLILVKKIIEFFDQQGQHDDLVEAIKHELVSQ